MMKFDSKQAFLKEDIMSYQGEVSRIHREIRDKTGVGNDRLGWVDWPMNYDKNEFETLVPNDGLILPTVTSGKAYRREMVLTLTADLRSGRLKAVDVGMLQMILRVSYHVPKPEVTPIISTLICQKVIHTDKKTGHVTVLPAGS